MTNSLHKPVVKKENGSSSQLPLSHREYDGITRNVPTNTSMLPLLFLLVKLAVLRQKGANILCIRQEKYQVKVSINVFIVGRELFLTTTRIPCHLARVAIEQHLLKSDSFKQNLIGGNSMALRSGNDAPKRGEYKVVGPRGGNHGTVQMPRKGATMPPTPKPGSTFKKK